MDVATALSAAQTLYATLHCEELRKLCSMLKYKSELQKLVKTVETIKSFLVDVDSKSQELTYGGQNWVQNLKDAVYEADDLFDGFNTIAQQLKRMPGGKVSKEVRRFFSSNNKLLFAFYKSREIREIREKLDSLAKNHRDFGFNELYKPVRSRVETCSYVYEQDIIGRDADKDAVVGLLLQDHFEENISFVSIVGIGGLGKTALAQLVFVDCRVEDTFEKKYWVCVSENFDLKDIFSKMLGKDDRDNLIGINELNLENLQREVRGKIEGKRFLLVLDDVWTENGGKWDELRSFLTLGGMGSRILVTSRSKKVAAAIGKYPLYELQGLSEKDSWTLFEKVSLAHTAGLVEIGKHIVTRCANVPLSIRVVASLLRGQDRATWQSFQNIDLAKLCSGDGTDEDGIMPALMFSYYHLAPELQSCFSFCSLFPKDYVIEKEMLIRLWSAQGYLVPSAANKDESMEDVGEKYVSILLQRCFFQDIKGNAYTGKVDGFKMHDLMHDLCRNVAGEEFMTLTDRANVFEGKFRHLSSESIVNVANWFSLRKTLRTYLSLCDYQDCLADKKCVDAIISKCRGLRVLDLHGSVITRTLPDTLGKLLHLRYLDLSWSMKLDMLPQTITKLHNLQTLNLAGCENLKELPENTRKLVNLRVLDIKGCSSLTHMPARIDEITCLHTLPMFVVHGDDDSLQDKKGKLADLGPLLRTLRDKVSIKHYGRACLIKVCQLTFYVWRTDETLLESMWPLLCNNHDLRVIEIEAYKGTKFPSWMSVMTSFSSLVSISLCDSGELQHLPSSMSQLCHLKSLFLECLIDVEYIESDAPSPSATFFPSLERLELRNMLELKGWWRDIRWMEKKEGDGCLVDANEQPVFIPSFPLLHNLAIECCYKMTYIPPCPHVKQLEIEGANEALTFCMKGGVVQSPVNVALSSNMSVESCILQELTINDSMILNTLFSEFVAGAIGIVFYGDADEDRMRKGSQSCVAQHLLSRNHYMASLEEILGNIKSLRTRICCRGCLEGMPWKSLHSLQSLNIEEVSPVTKQEISSLPEEMHHLTSLTTLKIEEFTKLKSLPEAMHQVTSLTTLIIRGACKELYDKCQDPNGEDWPKIRRIPRLEVQLQQVNSCYEHVMDNLF